MNLHPTIDSKTADRIIELAFSAALRNENYHKRHEDKKLVREFAAEVALQKDRASRWAGRTNL